jgi:hypothetical protein
VKLDVRLKVVAVLSCCLLSLGVVYASYTIYSNVVTVTVGGTLVLSASQPSSGTVDLSATLTRNGQPISDATVNFYNITGTRTLLSSRTTNPSGVALLSLSSVSDGTKQYQAEYVVQG